LSAKYEAKNSSKRERKCKEKEQKKSEKSVKVGYTDKTVEEIKDRYFQVAKAVLEFRGDHEHPIVKHSFDCLKEQKRKENQMKLFSRTKDDNEEEKVLYAELKKLDQLIKKTEKEEKQLEKLVRNETIRQEAVKNTSALINLKENTKNEKPIAPEVEAQEF